MSGCVCLEPVASDLRSPLWLGDYGDKKWYIVLEQAGMLTAMQVRTRSATQRRGRGDVVCVMLTSGCCC